MLVLGVNTKDKGSQLESLVNAELKSQGYSDVVSNVIGAGGNELDVVGQLKVGVLGASHVIPLLCEAKAYLDPVNMPTWQKFLGKLFLERSEKASTVGILVALNGVNGNVRGSFVSLKQKDDRVFIFDGKQLLDRARDFGAVSAEVAVHQVVESQFRRTPIKVESAYYGGGYFWVVRWHDDVYSIVDGHGGTLSSQKVDDLRDALAGSISGTLLAADEAQAQAESRHDIKAGLLNRLFQTNAITIDEALTDDEKEAYASLVGEPYVSVEEGHILLLPAQELDAVSIARLFISLFENAVAVEHLTFMIDGHHALFVERLIELLPEIQSGFGLVGGDVTKLRAVAPLFPSLWITLAKPIQMITTHRSDTSEVDESMLAADRNTFWDELIRVIRSDFTNVFLRGFLYDYVGVAELQETVGVTVKSKTGVVGTIETETRTAVRQLSEEYAGEAGTRHLLLRILPEIAEPWEGGHPEPVPLKKHHEMKEQRDI